jgi:hypothetical protein
MDHHNRNNSEETTPSAAAPLPTSSNNYGSLQQQTSQQQVSMSTYTAGEDSGRLATLAKEFGLSRQRPPRPQIRFFAPDYTLDSKLNLSSLRHFYGRMKSFEDEF